jgi:hypothetical protein
MTGRYRAVLSASFVASIAFGPRSAVAEPTSAARAAAIEMFDSGQKLVKAGDVAQACPKFAESYRLDPQLGALLHLADCYERDKKLASAYAAFRDAIELAGQRNDSRRALAEQRARALEPRLCRLTIEVPASRRVAGLEIKRDEIVLAEGSFGTAIAVDAGEHHIVATAPGRETWSTTVRVTAEGSSERVEVPELAATSTKAAVPVAAAPADKVLAPAASSGGTQRVLGLTLAGAGVVGVGLGAFFMVRSNDKLDERDAICPSSTNCEPGAQDRIDTLTNEADSARTASFVSFAVGGAAVLGGAVLFFTAPSGSAENGVSAALTGRVLPGGGALTLNGAF